MESGKVRLQHYVPAFYLRNFSIKNRKKDLIWVFDKKTEEIKEIDVENIACENEFFEKVSEGQVLEKSLSILEGKASSVIRKILEAKKLDFLSNNDKKLLSDFISIQMVRTRKKRNGLSGLIDQIDKRFGSNIRSDWKEEIQNLKTEEGIRSFHKDFLRAYLYYSEILMNLKWILIINKTGFPYWTSDHPVVLNNQRDLHPKGNLGLTSTGIEIYFPISSKICLLICDPKTFSHEPDRKISTNYSEVIRQKCLQVNQSARFIFSINKSFSFAKTMIKQNPALKDPYREKKIN